MSGDPTAIPNGGACAWLLPADARCASQARSALRSVLGFLGFTRPVIDDGVLAVSELATNAHQHARGDLASGPHIAPELWLWARTHPHPCLAVTVFDGRRGSAPEETQADLLDERGKGIALMAAVSASWGSHPSRSRLAGWPARGKAVWFTLPMPHPMPGPGQGANPAYIAEQLHSLLTHRGIDGVIRKSERGVSLVSVPCGLNIRVEPHALALNDFDGTSMRRQPLDLHDLAEFVVQRTEEAFSREHAYLPGTRELKPNGSRRSVG
ncbi:ATP-binding protein [Actinomadura sp. 6N118]|uniref:ATP-binding protein n=1 Tax=Actinomadura sp. 6N118 TaxID=3375151 RepID=UPI003794590D